MAPNVTCALLLFLSLKEKKKYGLPDLIYIFPSSASLLLEQGRWKQSGTLRPAGTQHHSSLWNSQTDVAPLSRVSQVSHAGQGRHAQSTFSLPPQRFPSSGMLCSPPPTPGWDNHSLEAARPCPQLLPAISLPSPCLCPSSFSPLTPLTMLLPSCPPVPSALALSSQVTPPPGSPLAT